uniref:DBF4B-CDC7 kinase regulatory subunit n=1 Tax=Cyprinus carpio carpio TaxID=630221 RepID=A0A9J7WU03_CYPCA
MAGELSGVLRGQSFYLHDVKRHQSVTLTDIISRLGGKVDSFLTKDVNVVVTGIKAPHSDLKVDGSCTAGGKQSGTPKPLVCGSRGKALLEKAIHSNEKYQSSVLANARSWGVKVYNVEEFVKFINHLNQKMRTAKKKRSKLTAPHVKAGVLRGPYLKVEDSSRKFRPYYAQTLSFPVISFSGKFSPFEPLIPRQSGKSKDLDSSKDNFRKKEQATSSCHNLQAPRTASATRRGLTKKSSGYCECCNIVYKDQYEHLESEMHRSFIQNDSNYAVVDQLTAAMVASFVCKPNLEVDPTLIKSSTGFSQLQLSNLTPMVESSVSENEKSLQTTLVQECDSLPANADNRGHPFPKPIQSMPGQQHTTLHHTMQNNSPDPLENVKLGLYISCTSKVQDFQSGVFCMDIVPHHSPPKSQSIEKKPKRLSSVTPSEAPSKMLTLSSSVDNKIPRTITGGKNLPETQERCEGGHDLHVLHMQSGLIGGVPNTFNSQNQKHDWDQGLKIFSNTTKMLLQQGEDGNSESCGQYALDHRKLPSTKQSLKSAKHIVGTPEFGISYFSLPNFLPFPHLSDYSFSMVNLKKRCRSFTQTPKLAKRRKISQNEKPNPIQPVCSAPWIRQYSSVLSTMSCLPIPKVGFTTEMNNQTGGSMLAAHKSSLNESSLVNQIPTRPPLKYFTPSTHCLPHQVDQQDNAAKKPCVKQSHELSPIKDPVESRITTYSSDLDPPQLVPFFHEDHQLQRHRFHDPPELLPFFIQTPEDTSHTSVSKATNSSFLSHSGASVCIESALLPNLTWSTASSESDWDSGLLSWFTAGVPLQAKGGHDDLGLLLQKPHTGMQDGSYTSRLCSILQPS